MLVGLTPRQFGTRRPLPDGIGTPGGIVKKMGDVRPAMRVDSSVTILNLNPASKNFDGRQHSAILPLTIGQHIPPVEREFRLTGGFIKPGQARGILI